MIRSSSRSGSPHPPVLFTAQSASITSCAGACLLLLSMTSSGCNKEKVCDKLAAKNKTCADAFDRYVESQASQWDQKHPIPRNATGSASDKKAADTSPATIGEPKATAPTKGAGATKKRRSKAEFMRMVRNQRVKKAKAALRSLFTTKLFLTSCRRAWNGHEKEDERLKKAARACLAKKDCDDYVACLMALKRKIDGTDLKPLE